jgi:acyl carrier protein
MSNDEIVDAIKEVFVTRLKVERDKIKPDANLFEDLDLDSIDLMTAVMAMEEQFGIEVSDTELENVRTVGDAAQLFSEKMGARA